MAEQARIIMRKLITQHGHQAARLFREEDGQDIAEYAVMIAMILVITVGVVRMIGTNASNVFSSVSSSIQ